jgi:hypothetical protein
MSQKIPIFLLIIITLRLAGPKGAEAYIGPGAGIAAIGTVIALIGGILLAIVAFIWYPIKRLIAKIKKKRVTNKEEISS